MSDLTHLLDRIVGECSTALDGGNHKGALSIVRAMAEEASAKAVRIDSLLDGLEYGIFEGEEPTCPWCGIEPDENKNDDIVRGHSETCELKAIRDGKGIDLSGKLTREKVLAIVRQSMSVEVVGVGKDFSSVRVVFSSKGSVTKRRGIVYLSVYGNEHEHLGGSNDIVTVLVGDVWSEAQR